MSETNPFALQVLTALTAPRQDVAPNVRAGGESKLAEQGRRKLIPLLSDVLLLPELQAPFTPPAPALPGGKGIVIDITEDDRPVVVGSKQQAISPAANAHLTTVLANPAFGRLMREIEKLAGRIADPASTSGLSEDATYGVDQQGAIEGALLTLESAYSEIMRSGGPRASGGAGRLMRG